MVLFAVLGNKRVYLSVFRFIGRVTAVIAVQPIFLHFCNKRGSVVVTGQNKKPIPRFDRVKCSARRRRFSKKQAVAIDNGIIKSIRLKVRRQII